jgi:hypothetical protein
METKCLQRSSAKLQRNSQKKRNKEVIQSSEIFSRYDSILQVQRTVLSATKPFRWQALKLLALKHIDGLFAASRSKTKIKKHLYGCIAIVFVCLMLLSLILAVQTDAAATWIIQTVDKAGDDFFYASLALRCLR